jgi:AbrB family looped-hinge helix DNA binding protein
MEYGKTVISAGGRVVIPAHVREELHMRIGQELIIKVEGGEVHLVPLDTIIKQAQNLVALHNLNKKSLTGALAHMRSEERND